jgi:hypothetical protein
LVEIRTTQTGGREMNTLWIARDEDKMLCLFEDKPYLVGNYYTTGKGAVTINPSLFPEVTFESGPVEVEIIIKKP